MEGKGGNAIIDPALVGTARRLVSAPMDVDRYITDAVLRQLVDEAVIWQDDDIADLRTVLSAALPHLYPLIRADVLREAADQLDVLAAGPFGTEMPALWLRGMADEAVDETVSEESDDDERFYQDADSRDGAETLGCPDCGVIVWDVPKHNVWHGGDA